MSQRRRKTHRNIFGVGAERRTLNSKMLELQSSNFTTTGYCNTHDLKQKFKDMNKVCVA
jgi:hypothetical protein